MRTSRRAAAAFGAALLASGLTIVSPVLTTSAGAAEVVVDGGFETAAGDPPVAPGWTAADSESETPICTPAFCPTPPAGVGPHSGDNYVLFGGGADNHSASIEQTVTLPVGSATLSYWLGEPQRDFVDDLATLSIRIDGKLVRTVVEGEPSIAYELSQLDISEFADGGSHTLAFDYFNDTGVNTMVVDDISIDAVTGPAPVQANADTLGPIPPGIGCNVFTYGPPRDVTFTVDKIGKPTDVAVRIAFNPEHTYAGDVLAVLIAPDGRRAQIIGGLEDTDDDGVSDDSNNLVGPYLFSDTALQHPSMEEASMEAEDGVIPPGHYRAVTTGGELITPAFAGLGNAKGTWTLRFRDLCDDDTGSVTAAALFLTTDGVAPADSNPPDTDITTSPANGIAKTLKVPFAFTSDETGVTYQCALDAAAYALCANPATITVKSGKHTLAVRARDAAGNLDPFPAKTTFTAYDCQSLNADVAKLKKKVKALKKAIKKTENKLDQAIADGDRAEVKELKAKLTKLEKKKTKKTKQLAKAKQAAAPCKA